MKFSKKTAKLGRTIYNEQSRIMINVKINKLPDSEVEIEGEIPTEQFENYRQSAVANINADVTIDGFRKGHATEQAIIAKFGAEKVLTEMAELALQKAYPSIVEEQKLDAIGRPMISITKIAKDNPLGFKIKTAINPEIKLGDCGVIAKKIMGEAAEKIEVTDKEADDLIAEVRKSRAKKDEKTGELGPEPELNDEFAKSLGKFEGLADLKTKLKENIKRDKEMKARDKRRLKIIEGIIKESDIPLPPVLVEAEVDKMLAEMRYEAERMNLKWDEYLGHLKKTEAELRAGWQEDAKKRVKTGLILGRIAQQEKITAPEEEIKKELDHLKQHYPNTSEDRLRQYVTSLITNEKVFEWLEGQK
ncbi:MAG: trigger factor [Patescibacteria group bacterium]|nr:trigger factor [Patescibacteria group bacterium]